MANWLSRCVLFASAVLASPWATLGVASAVAVVASMSPGRPPEPTKPSESGGAGVVSLSPQASSARSAMLLDPRPIDFGNLTLWDGSDPYRGWSQQSEALVLGNELYVVVTARRCGAAWSFWSPKDFPKMQPVVRLRVCGVYAVDRRPCATQWPATLVWSRTMTPDKWTSPWGDVPSNGVLGWLGSRFGGQGEVVTENTNEHEARWFLQYCGETKCWTWCWPAEPPELMVVLAKVEVVG